MNITMFGRTKRVTSKYWIANKLSICKILTSTGSSLYWKKRASLINRKCATLAWQSKTTHCKTDVGKDFGSEYENFTVFTLFSWLWSIIFIHFQFYTVFPGWKTLHRLWKGEKRHQSVFAWRMLWLYLRN